MKILRVDMTQMKVTNEDTNNELLNVGGRGLTGELISREVPALCDPLGVENKLILAPGLLSGTSMFNTSRISIGSKSPLTGTIKESNAGGTVSHALGNMGISAIIIEGQPSEKMLYNLLIDKEGGIDIVEASEYNGLGTYDLVQKLHEKYGKNYGVLCIGPAGEKLLLSASIQSTDVDGHPCRAAARGGLGAVMGSKGLKAIIVDLQCNREKQVSNQSKFDKAVKIFAESVRNHPFCGEELSTLGTAGTIEVVNSIGALSSYNSTEGTFKGINNVSGEKMAKTINERGGQVGHKGCTSCIVNCSNVFVNKKGGYITSSLEFETIWAMGPMTGVDDLDVIAQMDYMSDHLGLDTMNTGVAFAVAMDAGYKKFGDSQALIEMMDEIANFTKLGIALGNGPVSVGKYFNHHRVPCVKGQSIAAYDPRAMQGNGVTYATSPMGADHTAGNLLGVYLSGKLDALKAKGQIEASRYAQIEIMFLDSVGLCHFVRSPLVEPEIRNVFADILNAKQGTSYSYDDFLTIAEKSLHTELEFNNAAGIKSNDNRLPDFFLKEPLSPHNVVFSVSNNDIDAMFKNKIIISLKIHGKIREVSEKSKVFKNEKIELPRDIKVKDLFEKLCIDPKQYRAVINSRIVGDETMLVDGAKIEIFPQISGG